MRSFDVGEVDGSFWPLFEAKGVLPRVTVRDSESSVTYTVDFYSRTAVREAVDWQFEDAPFALLVGNIVVLDTVTPDHIQQAIDSMDLRDLMQD